MSTLLFVSGNKFKIAEAQDILVSSKLNVVGFELKITELQTSDTTKLVRDKALKAFRSLRRALFVEHTGLYLSYLNGLPGGLTQNFWDDLQADKFSEIFGNCPDRKVVAKTHICYIDGRQFNFFEGAVHGQIASAPSGNRDFQWDCVFIPDGYNKTFAELGSDQKNQISMRRNALDKLNKFLSEK